jgi:isoamylase
VFGWFLGARFTPDATAIEFCIEAPRAERVELSIFAAATDAAAALTTVLTGSTAGVFSGTVTTTALPAGATGAVYYGYRLWGPNWHYDSSWKPGSIAGFIADVDVNGNRFNPNKLLLDPYTLEVSHDVQTPAQPSRAGYQSGATSRLADTAPFAPKGIVLSLPNADFGAKPQRPFKDEIIYEVHLRGLTRNDPTVDAALRGTYAGAASRAAYLADLGITAVEFLPIHETQNALNDLQQYAGQQNYWGYDSISYFAPDRRYASDQSPGGPTREWIAMVKAFHAVGLKVYVDVVYNHHEEGDVDATGTVGAIYSLRGVDNPNYYEDQAKGGTPNLYRSDNGVGPNLNAAAQAARDLVIASLVYWTNIMGADGFRFDLAAVLGNTDADGGYTFDPSDSGGIIARAVTSLPARPAGGGAGVDLIAEPYTADAFGQEQGNFPAGWAEWNDRFRDAMRASQNKLGFVPVTPGTLATRFAGSDDLFRAHGRQPWSSVNYIVCHDGFTLRDLHSYNAPNNNQLFPYGPSTGGRAADEEMCWDHGGDATAQLQAARTGLALLLLSAGVPMIAGGSEIFRTQFGNNNAYNLDTIANWVDWTDTDITTTLHQFVRSLCQFRLAHPALRPAAFFTGHDNNGNGRKDITWYRENGSEIGTAYFENASLHFIAFQLDGTEVRDAAALLLVAYNGWIDPITMTLPPPLASTRWYSVADTSASAVAWGNFRSPGAEVPIAGATVVVGGRSAGLLIAK